MKKSTSNSMDLKKPALRFGIAAAMIAMTLAVGFGTAQAQTANSTQAGEETGNAHFLERNPGTGGPVRNHTIIPVCPTLGSLQMVDMGFDKALLTWTNTNVQFDSIVFRTTNMNSGLVRISYIPGNPNPGRYFMQGLLPHTIYEIEASTICAGIQSGWTNPITVTTLAPRAIGGQATIGTRVYINPNPATTTTLISFKSQINTSQDIMITNSTGQIVYRKTMMATSEKVQLPVDVTAFPNGLYIVKLTSSFGVTTERMIVQ